MYTPRSCTWNDKSTCTTLPSWLQEGPKSIICQILPFCTKMAPTHWGTGTAKWTPRSPAVLIVGLQGFDDFVGSALKLVVPPKKCKFPQKLHLFALHVKLKFSRTNDTSGSHSSTSTVSRSCTWQLASVTLKMKQVKPLVKAAMRLFPQPNESRPGHEHTSAHQMSIAVTRAATFILSACHPCSNVHISVAATSTGYRGVLTNETHCDLDSCDKWPVCWLLARLIAKPHGFGFWFDNPTQLCRARETWDLKISVLHLSAQAFTFTFEKRENWPATS